MLARLSHLLLASAGLAAVAICQVPQTIPYARQLDLMVADNTYEGVWRLVDRNQDGDFNDPGEVTSFYDHVAGGVLLSAPTCIACAPDGTTYVGDATTDIILRLRDLNGDGDAVEPGEANVFFDNTNAGGILMASVQGMTFDLLGRMFLAVANSGASGGGTTGSDMILLLDDMNGDGDANDTGEAIVYCLIPGGAGAVGNSIPTKVIAGPDSSLYYTEAGSTGVVTKGIWRLTDLNFDGDCNDPNEVSLFWTPPFVAAPFYYGLAVDQAGNFYVTDHSANEQVWRARDVNGNGTIEPGEQTLFYQTGGSTWWDIVVKDDGVVLLCDAQNPDRITALRDLNGDGDALDASESFQTYDSSIAAAVIAPRAMSMLRAPLMEVAPSVAHVGTTTNVVVWCARPFDLAAAIISLGFVPPLSLAPFGMLEIDPFASVVLGFGLADATGVFSLPLPIPNSPTAINPYAFQTLAGDPFRLFFSNSSLLTVIP